MLDYIDRLDFVTFAAPWAVGLIIGWIVSLQGESHVRSRDD